MILNIRSAIRALGAFLVTLAMGGTAAMAQSPEEQRAWEHAQAIGTIHDYESFLERYPDGVFAPDATNMLLKLIEARRANTGGNTYRKGDGGGGGTAGGNTSGY